MERVFRLPVSFLVALVVVAFCVPSAARQQTHGFETTLEDFESGLVGGGSIGWNPDGLTTHGPWYAWENPPSPAGDDINYWDVFSNRDNVDSPVDYELNFAAQDWSAYTDVKIKYFVWRDDGNDWNNDIDTANAGIRVYAYDASGTGNSDNNGFHLLGEHTGGGTVVFPLAGMTHRNQVVKIKIRVFESFFGGVGAGTSWGRQRTHLNSISLLTDRVKVLADTGGALSTYSPYVMHQPGWAQYRMYFGRNELDGDFTRDRIYLSENFGDGVTGWTAPMIVLRPDSPGTGEGERGLIHDPTVVVVGSTWHMYYTGIDCNYSTMWYCGFDGKKNAVFHAVSDDGVTWEKRGGVVIGGALTNADFQAGGWGFGDSSILYEDGKYKLYFFSDRCLSCGTVYAAESTDGQNFVYKQVVSDKALFHPEVREAGGTYTLIGSVSFHDIYRIDSDDPLWFPQTSSELLFTVGPAGWWDSYEAATPSFLPLENRVYYGGTDYAGDAQQPMEEGSIGVKRLP